MLASVQRTIERAEEDMGQTGLKCYGRDHAGSVASDGDEGGAASAQNGGLVVVRVVDHFAHRHSVPVRG